MPGREGSDGLGRGAGVIIFSLALALGPSFEIRGHQGPGHTPHWLPVLCCWVPSSLCLHLLDPVACSVFFVALIPDHSSDPGARRKDLSPPIPSSLSSGISLFPILLTIFHAQVTSPPAPTPLFELL